MAAKPYKAPGFFKSIVLSIYSPKLYSNVEKHSFGKALAYLFGWTFLHLLLGALILYGFFAAHTDTLEEKAQELAQRYPEELELQIEGGKVSTNVEEPYLLPLSEVSSEEFSNGQRENLLVIDTKTDFSLAQFKDYDAYLWLSEDSLHVLDKQNSVRSIDLSQVDHFMVNRSIAEETAQFVARTIIAFTPVFMAFAFIPVLFFIFIGKLFYLLFFALLIRAITELMNRSCTYATAYKMGIYAITLPSLVNLLVKASMPWTHFHGFPLMSTLIGLLVVAVSLQRAPEKLKAV